MSSSVSPRQRDIGEVARLRAEGVDRQPQSGFSVSLKAENFVRLQCCSYPNPSACGTSPIRAIARQRRTLRVCQLRSSLNPKPFLNPSVFPV